MPESRQQAQQKTVGREMNGASDSAENILFSWTIQFRLTAAGDFVVLLYNGNKGIHSFIQTTAFYPVILVSMQIKFRLLLCKLDRYWKPIPLKPVERQLKMHLKWATESEEELLCVFD